MPAPTVSQVNLLNNAFPAAKTTTMGNRIRDGETLQSAGRVASSHVRMTANATDGDTVTITAGGATLDGVFTPGRTTVYEFDNNAAVTAGRVLVTIGGTAALSAAALAVAIRNNQSTQVGAAQHVTDTITVDLTHRVAGAALTTATSAPARIAVQDNGGQLAKADYVMYVRRRTLTAEDIARTLVRVQTGLSSIDTYICRLVISTANNGAQPYNGTITVTGGLVEFTLGSAGGILAAGNILEFFAVGVR